MRRESTALLIVDALTLLSEHRRQLLQQGEVARRRGAALGGERIARAARPPTNAARAAISSRLASQGQIYWAVVSRQGKERAGTEQHEHVDDDDHILKFTVNNNEFHDDDDRNMTQNVGDL